MRRHVPLLAAAALLAMPALAAAHGTPTNDRAVGASDSRTAGGLHKFMTDDGFTVLTHGGDPKPGHGSDMTLTTPKLDPVCATDKYQVVLYGRSSKSTNRYGQVVESLRDQIRRNTWMLDASAKQAGGAGARYKVQCSSGTIYVGTFTTKTNTTSFDTIVSAARKAGFSSANADYTIFWDAVDRYSCGVGSYYNDERASSSNYNHTQTGYAVTYSDCWYGRTSMHENGHNQGAVQPTAPDSTGSGGHCNDVEDVMCYAPDGGDRNQVEILTCPEIWFDCNDDSYFDPVPEDGEWLSTRWNIGGTYNAFVTRS